MPTPLEIALRGSTLQELADMREKLAVERDSVENAMKKLKEETTDDESEPESQEPKAPPAEREISLGQQTYFGFD